MPRKRVYICNNFDVREICEDFKRKTTLANIPIRKILVSNISNQTTHKSLKNTFEAFGKVTDCMLKRQPNEKKSYAFITYRTSDDAETAINKGYYKHVNVDGNYLRVLPAASWHQPDANRKTNLSQSEGVENVSSDITPIHQLNEDCLRNIFSQLPIADHIKIERVCKRWQKVSKSSWHFHRKLNLVACDWGLDKPVLAPYVYNALHRCGLYLSDIDFSENTQKLGNLTLIAIGKLCPNLKRLWINVMRILPSGIKAIADNCHKIVNLKILSPCGPVYNSNYENEFSLLFSKNKNLQYVEIIGSFINGKCLLQLPAKSLKKVVLHRSYNLSDPFLQKFLELRESRGVEIIIS